MRLAIVTTHPVQYYAPFFQMLSSRGKVDLKVFYTWPQAIEGFDDPDFGKKVSWDIPLLDGYEWHASNNVSANPGSKTWSGIDCPDLVDEISEYKPNAVMVIGWNFRSHFRVMRYFKGRIPIWFTGDSTLLDEKPGIRKIIRRLLLKFVYSFVDKAFYVGSNNKAYFQAHGIKDKQLVFFPHAVDVDRFSNASDQHEVSEWRKELGFKTEDRVVLFCGKFEEKKNPALLVSAIKQMVNHEDFHNIKLLMVGNGPLEESLKRLAEGCNNIHFLPFQNQSKMPMVYRLGDLFVLPSQGPGETWGLAINEAMACGRSVIASDKVGCARDLIDGNNGRIFRSGDCDSLVDAIKEVLAGDLAKFGENSLLMIRDWSYQKKCESIEQFS
ncbi:MAG: glycosyltransferase family 4 protein [Cyclobacteriaceae bacterium]